MALEVRAVSNARDIDRFIALAHDLYAHNPYWVAPLDRDLKATLSPGHSPFWEHAERGLFLAERDGRPVGRIAAINDRNYNQYHNAHIGFFGFFESVNDSEVARVLLAAAEGWCCECGLTRVFGPANPSLNDECGLLVDSFDRPPVIKTSYNPAWYPGIIENAGYVKAKDFYAFRLDPSRELPAKLTRVVEALRGSADIVIRPLDLANFSRDIVYATAVYNDAWSQNWDFAPMTQVEIDSLARHLRPILEPALCPLVFYRGEIAGMAIGLPDYNQVLARLHGRLYPFGWLKLLLGRKRINRGRLWALGVKRRFRHLGLDALMYNETIAGARRLGYAWGEMSLILEDNEAIIRPMRLLGAEIYKTWRIYRKELDGAVSAG